MPSAPALADWQASIAGVIVGPNTDYELVDGGIEGWAETPGGDHQATRRPTSHGTFSADEWTGERILSLGLEIGPAATATMEQLLDAIKAITTPSGDGDAFEVWYKMPTRPVQLAYCKTTRRRERIDVRYEHGLTVVTTELHADDPYLYGETVEQSTTFPSPSGGLEFDLFTDGAGGALAYLEFGAASPDGRVTVANVGEEDIPVIFTITGPVAAQGFRIVQIGGDGLLQYEAAVGSGSVLTLDGDRGEVLLDAAADRSRFLTKRFWPTVPKGSSATFSFEPLGATSAASLTVSSAPVWW